MATNVTRARWESSRRGRGVVFDAESPDGKAKFIISPDTLADFAGVQDLDADQSVRAVESFADETAEAAGKDIAAGAGVHHGLVVISTDKLPNVRCEHAARIRRAAFVDHPQERREQWEQWEQPRRHWVCAFPVLFPKARKVGTGHANWRPDT